MKTVREITEYMLETDAERAWAERMGTDYRRAWETAPSVSVMMALGMNLTGRDGCRQFLSEVLTMLGGAPSLCDTLHDAIHFAAPPGARAVMTLIDSLPGMRRPESELAELLRARVSYESLRRLSDN